MSFGDWEDAQAYLKAVGTAKDSNSLPLGEVIRRA